MTTQDAILSSGTLATLTGITDCNALDRIQAEFLEWIEKAGQKFANWQEAWNEFYRHTNLDPIISQLECSIYVVSLSDYNSGLHYGRWIDCLSCDADEVQDQIDAMLAASPTARRTGQPAEEWAIHDHGGFHGIRIRETENIEELCSLAAALEEHGAPFAAFFDYAASGSSVETCLEQFEDAYQGTFRSLEEWAEDHAESSGMLESIPENLRCYFDFERFARDCEINGDIFSVETEEGLAVFTHY